MYNFMKYFSYLLVLIGALNWGLIGLFNFNLVTALFGEMTLLTQIIYILVGLASIVSLITSYMCYVRHRDRIDL